MHWKLNRRGRIVAAVLGLFILSTAQGSLLAQQGQQPGDLPSGEKLMDDYIKATGGKEAYEKVKTYIIRMTYKIASVEGEGVIHGKTPNLMHFSLNLQGIGNIEAGYDGKVFWENNAITGPKITDSGQQPLPGLDFGDLNWRQVYKSVKTEGVEKINDKEVYKVQLEDKKGEKEHRYFDKATGLVVNMKKTMKNELGNFVMDMSISNYKKVGDLLMPHSVSASLLGQKIDVQLKNIQLNAPIPMNKFALPMAVEELLKKKEKDQNR